MIMHKLTFYPSKKLFILILLFMSTYLQAQNSIIPGSVRIDATFESLAINYSITGDNNRNSNLIIRYRPQGLGSYQDAAMTMRAFPGMVIDGNSTSRNYHAGSALFLNPATSYDIQLILTDPDGGGTTSTLTTSTKAIPEVPASSTTRYVAPGNGGGSGSLANPYLGLQAAADAAQPGDHFVVAPGTYGAFELNTSGTAAQPVSFISEFPNAAIIDGLSTTGGIITLGVFDDSLQYTIIDGFTIRNGVRGIDAQNTQYLTVRNCLITDINYGIVNRRENGWEHDQYFTNNYLIGRNVWPQSGIQGDRGIDIRGNRNVVSYNYIEKFGDGVSTDGPPYETSYALDIHHNDIREITDDLIEVDGTISNTRIYNNRGFNGRAGVSVAPIYGGPCYVFRNELFNLENSAMKMNRGPSGLVVVHNVGIKTDNAVESPDGWQNTFYRNNLFVGDRYCFEFFGLVSGSVDDWDYGAYKSTRGGGVNTEEFKWNNIRYATVPDLQASGILEANCVQVEFSDFGNINLPDSYTTEYFPEDRDFMPTANSPVVNSGANIVHLNEPYVTDGAADRGVYERGMPLPEYGPDYDFPGDFSGNELIPGTVRLDATFEHISIQYPILGDNNLNSTLEVRYKAQGASTYKNAAMSMRAYPGLIIDGSALGMNFHAASVMHLEPGSSYDIQLVLTDVDGGSTTTTIVGTTKAIPFANMSAVKYVAPGNGGGSGTLGSPYLGLQAAADNAQPGDYFIVATGTYAPVELLTGGSAGAPISFVSEELHGAVIDGNNTDRGIITLGEFSTNIGHVIIDGFTIQNGSWGIDAQNTNFITVRNNIIQDVGYGYVNRRESGLESDQYITNNVITGRTVWPSSGTPNERGVDIRGNNNVVSCNTIQNFGDGISTDGPPYRVSYSLDIHNNDIRNVVDDHIEVDGAISNTRIYNNQCYNGRSGISVAPVFGGPVYIFRNEMFNFDISAFKMNRSPSGLIVVNNTVVNESNATQSPDGWQNTFYRNNVIFASRYCFEMFGLVNGSTDDWDYGAYYSTRGGGVNTEWFKWNNIRYATVTELTASGILEGNAVEVAFSDFENVALPAPYPVEYTPDQRDFMPKAGTPVINSGDSFDNINGPYITDGMPDRGALELGRPLPKYGANFDTGTCEVALDLCVWLEGVYTSNSMTNTLENLGVLPAQQAYNQPPWNYNGTELLTGSGVADWVLVSFRTGIDKESEIGQVAGLLQQNGCISFPEGSGLSCDLNTPVYIVIEHRNHLPAMTPQPVSIVNNTLTFDFRSSNSYNNFSDDGQKQLPDGNWCLYVGNINQMESGYDINGADKAAWANDNGLFNDYYSADLNMDGDVNGADKALWNTNNGIFSSVLK